MGMTALLLGIIATAFAILYQVHEKVEENKDNRRIYVKRPDENPFKRFAYLLGLMKE